MKIINIIKLTIVLVVFNSCTNDYLKYPNSEEKILRLSKNKVLLPDNTSAIVYIVNGVGGYSVESKDNSKATARMVGKKVYITPKDIGNVDIVVKDTQTSLTETIKVEIKIIDFEGVEKVTGTTAGQPYIYSPPNNKKARIEVNIPDFEIDRNEVTVEKYCEFLNDVYKSEYPPKHPISTRIDRKILNIEFEINNNIYSYKPKEGYDNFPMVGVDWLYASEYANWKGGRLPTSVEFEYASQGGLNGPGNGTNLMTKEFLDDHAWYWRNTLTPGQRKGAYATEDSHHTHSVMTKKANSLGLFDMIGNASEWVQDDYFNGDTSTFPIDGGAWTHSNPLDYNRKTYQGGCFGFDHNWMVYQDLIGTIRGQNKHFEFYALGFRVAYDK